MRMAISFLCWLALALTGCVSPRTRGAPSGNEQAETSSGYGTGDAQAVLPDAEAQNPDKVARLKPGLAVQVDVLVLGKKEIEERSKRVSDEGTIMLPLVGAIRVEGMTLMELSAELARRYGTFFVRPQVVVDFVTEKGADVASPWGYVTVLGSVKNPGRVNIPATQDLTLSAAIQQAGGLKPSGKESAIKVSRRGESGKSETFDVNLRALGTRGEKGEDPTLQAGDVVFVPEMVF